MAAVSHISFSAQWIPPIAPVNPQQRTLAQKVYGFVKSSVFFIPNLLIGSIVRWCVLPSSFPLFMPKIIHECDQEFKQAALEDNADPHTHYITSELEVTTPDHIKLSGHFVKHKKHDDHPAARVIILFHGNGDFYQSLSWNWLPELLKDSDTPYSFLLFNPRGVGREGTPNEQNLLIDAESIYQTARDKLGISEDRIDLYGHSLGGAQAAQLKKLHPQTGGRLFLDRTFSSLDKVVSHIFSNHFSFVRDCAQKVVKHYGWEFDNYKAVTPIEDRVHIFTHLQDGVIPRSCSLGKAVESLNPHPETISTHFFIYSGYDDSNPHMDPLSSCRKEKGSIEKTKALLLDCFNHGNSAQEEVI